MMRSLMMSYFIITLVVAVNVVDSMEALYFEDTGKALIGYRSQDNSRYDNIFNEQTGSMSAYSESNINGTLGTYTKPFEQSVLQEFLEYIDTGLKTLRFLGILFGTILMGTVNFGGFINGLFFDALGSNILPLALSVPLSILVGFNHLIAIMQFMRGFNIEN